MLSFRGSFRGRESNDSMQNGLHRPGNHSLYEETQHRYLGPKVPLNPHMRLPTSTPGHITQEHLGGHWAEACRALQ